jgi:hypothetical protein
MGGVVDTGQIDPGNRSVPTACTGWSVTDELWAEYTRWWRVRVSEVTTDLEFICYYPSKY